MAGLTIESVKKRSIGLPNLIFLKMKPLSLNFTQKINYFFFFLMIVLLLVIIRQNTELSKFRQELGKNLNYFRQSQESERQELKNQLSLLREELIRYKSQQEGRDQILALSLKQGRLPSDYSNLSPAVLSTATVGSELISTPSLTANQLSIKGIVKLKKNWQKADVYEDKRASSKIIGEIVKDKLYFVYETMSGWYQIEFQTGRWGWVQASLVDEI